MGDALEATAKNRSECRGFGKQIGVSTPSVKIAALGPVEPCASPIDSGRKSGVMHPLEPLGVGRYRAGLGWWVGAIKGIGRCLAQRLFILLNRNPVMG